MKAIFLSLIFVVLILVSGPALVLAPYYLYKCILEVGADNHFISINKNALNWKGQKIEEIRTPSVMNGNTWENYFLQNLKLKIPLRDLSYYFIPQIRESDSGTQFDLIIKNKKKEELVEVSNLGKEMFDLFPFKDKIFLLPIFTKYIYSQGKDQVWKDIFSKKIRDFNFVKTKPILDTWRFLWKIPYTELAYNLYILKLRNLYLKDSQKYGTSRTSNYHYLIKEDSEYKYNEVKIYHLGEIYNFRIKTVKNHPMAKKIYETIMNNLSLSLASESSSLLSYAKFKSLAYQDKMGQIGFLYLYSGWTQHVERVGFLKEMILYLEKSEESLFQLSPLYQYSYQKYGTNFSALKREENLEMKIENEQGLKLEKEIEEESSISIEDEVLGRSREKEVKYNLKKSRINRKRKKNINDGSILSY